MAEEIALDIKIKTAESAATVQDLKKSLKELKNELNNVEAGSASFHKLTKSINDTEGKLGDLNDSFQTLTGSGVERASKSFNLFKEGLTTFDFGKIKASLGGLSAAFSAIPIFLIVEGLKYLWDNFDKVSEIVKSFTKDVFGLASASDDLLETQKALKVANDDLRKSIDAEIVALSGLKKNEEEILVLKEKKLKMSIEEAKIGLQVALARQAEAEAEFDYNEKVLMMMGKTEEAQKLKMIRTIEERNATKTAIAELKSNIAALQGFRNEQQQKELDEAKKHLDEKAKLNKEHEDELLKQHQSEVAKFEQARKDEAEREKQAKIDEINALNQSVLDAEAEYQNDSYVQEQNAKQAKDIADARRNEINLENEKAFKKQSLAVTVQALQSTQALTDLYFAHQLRQAKGNAEREKEIKKKQFQLNKAFAVAQIVLNTIQSITQAISSSPPPLSWVLAGINSAMGTAATIAALAQKFEDGGSPNTNIDLGGGNVTASAPAIPQPNNSVTKISDEGKVIDKPMNQRVYVLETDISDSNKKVASIEETAKI